MVDLKKYTAVIILTVLAVLCIAFIWSNSAKSGVVSGEESSFVCELVNSVALKLGKDEPISEHFIRKMAHFTEYMILGFLVCSDAVAFCSLRPPKNERIRILFVSMGLFVPFLVACVDEFVFQALSVGRGPSWRDVLIDSSGALTALVCVTACIYIFRAIKRGKKYANK